MAEIEFKRRGTPLWAVVLVLLVIAAVLYAIFGRRSHAPTPTPADTTAASRAPAPAAAPTPTPAAPAAPAAPTGPVPALAAWVDSTKAPTDAAALAAYTGAGLRLVAAALQERAPMAGVQQLLVRSMADTLQMPSIPPRKQLDAAQAAFFATAFAMRQTPGGARLETAAQAIQLTRPLTQQRQTVQRFFEVARDVMRNPAKGPADTAQHTAPSGTPGAAPAPGKKAPAAA